MERPLTMLVAPAGAGKTVLLAQWMAANPEIKFVWISVEDGDDDPVRFARRLLGGLSAISPDLKDLAPQVAVHGRGLGQPFLESLSARLHDLPPTAVVLDDLHHLSSVTLTNDLATLVELLPPNVHLVLSTRMDLPLAWSRRRLRRDLLEVRQSDLAFDNRDSADLLERICGARLHEDGVAVLVNHTEGWVTGLQLAGMALRDCDDQDDFIAQFGGDDHFVADYLSGEVLDNQTPQIQNFLLDVSAVDQMCAPLARELTGNRNAQLLLERLERESMFLVPLDSRREWFRFHHLFRDLLRFRLRARHPDAEAELLGKAATWHLGRGELSPAVEYLLRAKDWQGALRVITSRGSDVYEAGEMATMIRWINAVPSTELTGRHVGLLLAALQIAEGQAARAEDGLRAIAATPGATQGERTCALALLPLLAQWRSRPDATVIMAERALQALTKVDPSTVPSILNLSDTPSLETTARISGGRGHFFSGHYVDARKWLESALQTEGAMYSVWKVHALGSLGLLEAWCGDVQRGEVLAEEALELARKTGRLEHPATADAHLARAFAFLERGEPRRAGLSLHEGAVGAEINHRTHLMWISRLGSALIQEADGHPERATETLSVAERDIAAPPPPIVAQRVLALRARLLRLGGHPEQAQRVFAGSSRPRSVPDFEEVAAALATEDHLLARKLLASIQSFEPGQPLLDVEHLILSAWLSQKEGHNDAVTLMADAVSLAERHGLVEVFVRGGPLVVRLVAQTVDSKSTFREVIIGRARRAISPSLETGMAEQLTDRELEILSYLPSRLTNAEIASNCYVSVNTVKTHVARIYRKLPAATRDQAIQRARDLGLV